MGLRTLTPSQTSCCSTGGDRGAKKDLLVLDTGHGALLPPRLPLRSQFVSGSLSALVNPHAGLSFILCLIKPPIDLVSINEF